jgi:hypothetical protein
MDGGGGGWGRAMLFKITVVKFDKKKISRPEKSKK